MVFLFGIIDYLKGFFLKFSAKSILLPVGGLLLTSIIGYGTSTYLNLKKENYQLNQELTLATNSLQEIRGQNIDLSERVADAQRIVNEYGNKVGEIASTVGNLQKLSETDKELLQKYSKVYFLSDNYVPKNLSFIATSSLYRKDRLLQIHTGAKPYLEKLVANSFGDGLNLLVISAYRSFGAQSSLKSSYKFTYGVGANQFSAEQGYSEHQLGTALDFTTPTIGETFSGFSKTKEFIWLKNNAHKYGFVLSYPEGNTYYVYEPWHWRFIGVELATKLHDEGKYFYDYSQRDIDVYLLKIFN